MLDPIEAFLADYSPEVQAISRTLRAERELYILHCLKGLPFAH